MKFTHLMFAVASVAPMCGALSARAEDEVRIELIHKPRGRKPSALEESLSTNCPSPCEAKNGRLGSTATMTEVDVHGQDLTVREGAEGRVLLRVKGQGGVAVSIQGDSWVIRRLPPPSSPRAASSSLRLASSSLHAASSSLRAASSSPRAASSSPRAASSSPRAASSSPRAASSALPPAKTASRAELSIEGAGPVAVGKGSYFGRLEVRASTTGLQVVNCLPLETYLLGVLGSEMSSQWPLEALRAQAVASRTYALQRIKEARSMNRFYDLKATVLSQVYNGAENIGNPVKRAVISTQGEVLVFDHQLAEALFHSTCGGHTVSSRTLFGGERPYLVERPCSWCRASPYYRWRTSSSLQDIYAALKSSKSVRGPIKKIEHQRGQHWVKVRDAQGSTKMPLKVFRRHTTWKLTPSEYFRAKTRGKTVYFEGQGFGHRVGLCQWGARSMADAGRTYTTILEYYYPNTYVQKIY